ncbi:MAG: hypothetical protein G01um101416_388 [Microgenomates group bacterium Gr01-1014_16]|nr:MAG: hypothetical protein G01um101416_388 [Microgenomates group bacterium Gr01-1014_16]
MTRVFVDTNVWFSAFYGSPHCEKIIKAHLEGKIKAVINRQVLTELVTNITKKIPNAVKPLQTFLESSPPEIVTPPQKTSVTSASLAHSKDLPILLSAHQAGVGIFVTGNIKDFKISLIKQKLGLEILTPAAAVSKLYL